MIQQLRNYFLTGLFTAAPILITGYLTWVFIDTVDNIVVRNLPPRYNPDTYLPFSIPGLGILIMIAFLTLFGALATNFMGRTLIRMGERIVDRMPIVKSVYATLKQIIDTISAQNSDTFKEVVLVEYPRKGIWSLALVSSPAKGPVQARTPETMLNVFLPTTPNPTNGFLLYVPREQCLFLDMSVEEAIKYVISAGLVGKNNGEGETLAIRPPNEQKRAGDTTGDGTDNQNPTGPAGPIGQDGDAPRTANGDGSDGASSGGDGNTGTASPIATPATPATATDPRLTSLAMAHSAAADPAPADQAPPAAPPSPSARSGRRRLFRRGKATS
ncbi:putative membrane protein [Rhodothalassium salexigens DSM 2132]|uniref:Putative membrane protein n=1 Tax=Rhodothalassium salexigens DSM 2132 TaxID=1188247 RepID=A0A4R2PPS7_RHOSA|nr:DUF502 domain-containing protein [Rhodothalassium salexigens]MBB4210655.1 putative membrane protein [Rhodothalassium salexigens DSM 2132]MBK1637856.1 hypothetical protein [Rhodothalassium salexigens DSM 2132]TCP37789.1 putative membrane protein [Rhodothalassium salexigens DSM 2132]